MDDDQYPDDNSPADNLGTPDISPKPAEIPEPSKAYQDEGATADEMADDRDPVADVREAEELFEQATEDQEDDGEATESPDLVESDPDAADDGGTASSSVRTTIVDSPLGGRDATMGVGLSKDIPTEEVHGEAAGPSDEDVSGYEDSFESFGDKLNAFNEAGGADNSIPDIDSGEDGGGEEDSAAQLNDSDFGFKSKMSDMVIEQARRIDELTRALEAERL